MLSQLAQWQQSRKVFFLRATHQQWNEVSAEERVPLQRPFQKLSVFQTSDTAGQVSPEQQRQRTGALALAQQTGLDLSHPPPHAPAAPPQSATEWQKMRASIMGNLYSSN